ncbi:MAG TPA: amidophosphoribosyltransferase [Porphyromonadaceae bacterium]|nr:amidophosphoribosyltransferase [Porphyromonadaceae bacterium]
MTMMKGWIDDLIGMVFPRVCEVCGQSLVHGEEYLCLGCFVGMPRTGIHCDAFNAVHQRLAGKTPVDRAASMYWYYRQSDYARLIHEAKYRGRPALARWLGQRYAAEIKPDRFFDGIDLLLPVPMHFLKRMFRGYNQAEAIARGVSVETGIPVGHNLVARRGHATQTRKDSYGRYLNSRGIYGVRRSEELSGRHLLVIDDVVTTGATLLACLDELHAAAPTATLSVLTLAATHLR